MTEDLSKYKQPFDPDWPHGHTHLGKPARLICRDLKGGPYVFAVPYNQNHEQIWVVGSDGHFGATQVRNAPAPKRTWWLNIYLHLSSSSEEFIAIHYETKEDADRCASSDRIACIKITEGEGLEDD